MEQIKPNETPKFWHLITVASPDDVRVVFDRFFQAVKVAQPGQSIVLPISNDVALVCHGPWKLVENLVELRSVTHLVKEIPPADDLI